jgi:hypothetical protein
MIVRRAGIDSGAGRDCLQVRPVRNGEQADRPCD